MIESYKIESEAEADYYLNLLFEKKEHRSMIEVEIRAKLYIHDEKIKFYFIEKARDTLKTFN